MIQCSWYSEVIMRLRSHRLFHSEEANYITFTPSSVRNDDAQKPLFVKSSTRFQRQLNRKNFTKEGDDRWKKEKKRCRLPWPWHSSNS